jgi:RNA polymerase-binding transcription factor DksA
MTNWSEIKVLLKMQNQNSSSQLHYSDEELNEFKLIFETKLSKAQNELKELKDLFESEKDALTKEQLKQFKNRNNELIDHCKKSLIRIEDKTYGISKETGELIEKEKLLAVPNGKKQN